MAKLLMLVGVALLILGAILLIPAFGLLQRVRDPLAVLNAPLVMNAIIIVVAGIVTFAIGRSLRILQMLGRRISSIEEARQEPSAIKMALATSNEAVSTLNAIHASTVAELRKLDQAVNKLGGVIQRATQKPVSPNPPATTPQVVSSPVVAAKPPLPGAVRQPDRAAPGVSPYWSVEATAVRYEGRPPAGQSMTSQQDVSWLLRNAKTLAELKEMKDQAQKVVDATGRLPTAVTMSGVRSAAEYFRIIDDQAVVLIIDGARNVKDIEALTQLRNSTVNLEMDDATREDAIQIIEGRALELFSIAIGQSTAADREPLLAAVRGYGFRNSSHTTQLEELFQTQARSFRTGASAEPHQG